MGSQSKRGTKAKRFTRSAKQPFRPSNAGATWAELWPKLRAGKPVSMADVVEAWGRVMVDRNLADDGPCQTAEARASLYVTACLRMGLLARYEGKPGQYVYGGKYPLERKRKAEAPVAEGLSTQGSNEQ